MTSSRTLLGLLAALTPATRTPASEPAWAAQERGRAVAFVAERAPGAPEARVRLAVEPFVVAPGDRLEYRLHLGDGAPDAAGVEIAFDDGARLVAPTWEPEAGWREVQAELGPHVGRRALGVELVARGRDARRFAFLVADLCIARAEGALELLPPAAALGTILARDAERGAGAVVVDEGSQPAAGSVEVGRELAEPWAVLDLSALRAGAAADEPAWGARAPRGLAWSGPCAPLRFAAPGEARAGFTARGQTVALGAIAGGRYHELWLALENSGSEPVTATIAALGLEDGRLEIPFTCPPRPADGSATVIALTLAARHGVATIELPDDPSLGVLAITALWRADGPADPSFRARWLEQTAAELPNEDAAAWSRYAADRRVAAAFGLEPAWGAEERPLYDALLAEDVERFRGELRARLGEREGRRTGSVRARVELVGLVTGAADVLALPAETLGAPAIGLMPHDLELLARRDAQTLTGLAERARDGAWQPFGAPWIEGASARAGESSLVRLAAEGQRASARLVGAPSRVARLDGDPGRLAHLPRVLAAAGIELVLAPSGTVGLRSGRSLWSSGEARVELLAPALRIQGPLAFDLAAVRRWQRAGAAQPLLAACELSGSWARESIALADLAAQAPSSPEVTWLRASEPERELASWVPPAPAALDPARAEPELAALRALREAELALARFGAVEALAAREGAAADPRHAGLWLAQLAIAAGEAADVSAAARAVAQRADRAAAERLAGLAAALPAEGEGVPLAVLDSVPWPRSVRLELAADGLRARDEDGRELAVQPTPDGRVLIQLELDGLAPRALRVRDDPTSAPVAPASSVRISGWVLANDALEAQIDEASGLVRALRERTSGRELLGAQGQRLAWCDAGGSAALGTPASLEILERGPLRARVRATWKVPGARVTQEIALESGAGWLELRTRVEPDGSSGENGGRLEVELPHFAPSEAVCAVPLGWAAIDPDGALRALDAWVAVRAEGSGTALLGDAGQAYRLGADALTVLAICDGSWSAFGLAPAGPQLARVARVARERLSRPVLRAFETEAAGPRRRAPLVVLSRLESDGRRSSAREAGVALLDLRASPDGRLEIVLAEERGEPAQIELVFERGPDVAELVDLAGQPRGELALEGRRLRLDLAAGAIQALAIR